MNQLRHRREELAGQYGVADAPLIELDRHLDVARRLAASAMLAAAAQLDRSAHAHDAAANALLHAAELASNGAVNPVQALNIEAHHLAARHDRQLADTYRETVRTP